MSWFDLVAKMHAKETWSLEPEYLKRKNIIDNFVMHFTLRSATFNISNNI